MESFAPGHETYWIVQPLLEAGLPPEEIRDLVVRLGFEAVVCDGRRIDARVRDLVDEHPPDVRGAWVETITRMITGPAPDC